jgi:hypothetical protein
VPIFQKEANGFITSHHRHHIGVVGSIFQIGCRVGEELIGVAICGRPVGHKIDFTKVIEVNRLCVVDGHPNACSKLYSTCARIAKEMGYHKIITYTLESESGISLKAAGWFIENSKAGGKQWNSSGDRIRVNEDLFGNKKYPEKGKIRWAKQLIISDNETKSK